MRFGSVCPKQSFPFFIVKHSAKDAGEYDVPALSYAFHTAFAPPGIVLRVTASDMDLLGGRTLVGP